MLTTHNVCFLSSSASLFPSSVPTVGSADNISFLFTVSESVSELQNWCYRELAVRSNSLDFCRAVSQSASQCRPGKVLSVYVHADKQTRCFGDKSEWRRWSSSYRHTFFHKFDSATHAQEPGFWSWFKHFWVLTVLEWGNFTKILRYNIFWGLLSRLLWPCHSLSGSWIRRQTWGLDFTLIRVPESQRTTHQRDQQVTRCKVTSAGRNTSLCLSNTL